MPFTVDMILEQLVCSNAFLFMCLMLKRPRKIHLYPDEDQRNEK